MTTDEQVELLWRDYNLACAETAADQGDEIVESGGWVELARATADLGADDITDEAKREFLRMSGLGWR